MWGFFWVRGGGWSGFWGHFVIVWHFKNNEKDEFRTDEEMMETEVK